MPILTLLWPVAIGTLPELRPSALCLRFVNCRQSTLRQARGTYGEAPPKAVRAWTALKDTQSHRGHQAAGAHVLLPSALTTDSTAGSAH